MSAFNRLPSHTSRGLWKIPSYPLWKNESEKGKYYLSIIMKIVFTLEPWWSLARTWRTVGRFGGKTRSHCSQTALGGCTSGRVCAGHGRCEHSGPGAQAAVRAEVPIPPPKLAGWVVLGSQEAGFWLTSTIPFTNLLWNVGREQFLSLKTELLPEPPNLCAVIAVQEGGAGQDHLKSFSVVCGLAR